MNGELALYYPYIHFSNDSWIKQAALYWDRVNRIVPAEYEHKLHDSDVVKALRDQADLIGDRRPPQEVVHAVSEELSQTIDRHGATLQQHLSPEGFLEGNTDSLAYLYHSKMDDELVQRLTATGLGTYRRKLGDAEDEWLGVHPKIGQAYMTALASAMGTRGQLDVVSDDPRFAIAGCGFSIPQLFASLIEGAPTSLDVPGGDRRETTLGLAAIKRVLPKEIVAVPVKKIIEFRNESAEERIRYRDSVRDLTADLSEVRDAVDLRDHLAVRGERIEVASKALEKKMNRLLGDTVLAAVGVSKDLPQLAADLVAVAGISAQNPLVAAAGFAFNLIKAVRDKRQEMEGLHAHPYAYLVSLREEFSASDTINRLLAGARRLVLR